MKSTMRIKQFSINFTEYIPEELEDGILYISMEYATASHKCACGCGQEVVTPFTPTDWKLIYDGESVTLTPSIGNWSYSCRAHYLIRHNKIVWANDMSSKAIERGRHKDMINKTKHYVKDPGNIEGVNTSADKTENTKPLSKVGKFLAALARFFRL